MRFRLTYEGLLYATQGESRGQQPVKRADHKHEIRRHFHHQLKQLWKDDPFLSSARISPYVNMKDSHIENGVRILPDGVYPLLEVVSTQYQNFGYSFVPLVNKYHRLVCSLNILFLRRDPPGGAINAGDIDNRIKTLIDTLRCPQTPEELKGNEKPGPDEQPFFCLLEDDKLVTHFSVETDRLLDPASDGDHDVRLVITIDVKPYFTTLDNVGYI